MGPGFFQAICEWRHSLGLPSRLNNTLTLQRRATASMVFSVMTQEAAASANASAQRQKSDLLRFAYLGSIGIVTLAWIAGLVWGAIAFFNWLVS